MIKQIPKVLYDHVKGICTGKWDMERLRNANAIYKQRSARGRSVLDINRDLIIGLGILKLYGFHWALVVPAMMTWGLGMYFVGYFDDKVFKFWQKEREKADLHANPFNEFVKTSLQELLDRKKEDDKK